MKKLITLALTLMFLLTCVSGAFAVDNSVFAGRTTLRLVEEKDGKWVEADSNKAFKAGDSVTFEAILKTMSYDEMCNAFKDLLDANGQRGGLSKFIAFDIDNLYECEMIKCDKLYSFAPELAKNAAALPDGSEPEMWRIPNVDLAVADPNETGELCVIFSGKVKADGEVNVTAKMLFGHYMLPMRTEAGYYVRYDDLMGYSSIYTDYCGTNVRAKIYAAKSEGEAETRVMSYTVLKETIELDVTYDGVELYCDYTTREMKFVVVHVDSATYLADFSGEKVTFREFGTVRSEQSPLVMHYAGVGDVISEGDLYNKLLAEYNKTFVEYLGLTADYSAPLYEDFFINKLARFQYEDRSTVTLNKGVGTTPAATPKPTGAPSTPKTGTASLVGVAILSSVLGLGVIGRKRQSK